MIHLTLTRPNSQPELASGGRLGRRKEEKECIHYLYSVTDYCSTQSATIESLTRDVGLVRLSAMFSEGYCSCFVTFGVFEQVFMAAEKRRYAP